MRRERASEAALRVLEKTVSKFPGLVHGGDICIDSEELLDFIYQGIMQEEDLDVYLSVFTIDSEITKE